jgi:hypothetical protein
LRGKCVAPGSILDEKILPPIQFVDSAVYLFSLLGPLDFLFVLNNIFFDPEFAGFIDLSNT